MVVKWMCVFRAFAMTALDLPSFLVAIEFETEDVDMEKAYYKAEDIALHTNPNGVEMLSLQRIQVEK